MGRPRSADEEVDDGWGDGREAGLNGGGGGAREGCGGRDGLGVCDGAGD